MMPVAWLVPAFGGPALPAQARLGLGLSLAALALPQLVGVAPPTEPLAWILLLAREVAVGVTIGFVAGTVFRAAEAAGRLVDTMRGANFAEVIAPMSEGRTSPTGALYLFLAILVFLELGGLAQAAVAVARSYEAVPLVPPALPARPGAVVWLAIATSAKMIEAAVSLAAPGVVALMMTDVTLGMIGRAVPQLPVYFLGMPAKALLGVGVVLIGMGALEAALVAAFDGWTRLLDGAAAAWR